MLPDDAFTRVLNLRLGDLNLLNPRPGEDAESAEQYLLWQGKLEAVHRVGDGVVQSLGRCTTVLISAVIREWRIEYGNAG